MYKEDKEKFVMYNDDHKLSEIICDKENKEKFTIYFVENGKTVDTFYFNPKN